MTPSAVFVAAVAPQKEFLPPANFQEIMGTCRRLIHMFCRPPESIWPGSSWKAVGDVVGVRCWRVPIAGRQASASLFLFRILCPCRRS